MDELPKMSGLGKHNEFQCAEATRLVMRQAQLEDDMDILRWRNDPLVCAMSRHHEPISEMAHKAWYSRAVDDPGRLLLIGVLDGQKIGFVRFDHKQASLWEVSITVAPEARGRALGRQLLEMALRRLYSAHLPISVLAVVRLNNKPSLKLFHTLGFSREGDDGVFASLVLSPNASKLSP